jgi:hypothetical protein
VAVLASLVMVAEVIPLVLQGTLGSTTVSVWMLKTMSLSAVVVAAHAVGAAAMTLLPSQYRL